MNAVWHQAYIMQFYRRLQILPAFMQELDQEDSNHVRGKQQCTQ